MITMIALGFWICFSAILCLGILSAATRPLRAGQETPESASTSPRQRKPKARGLTESPPVFIAPQLAAGRHMD